MTRFIIRWIGLIFLCIAGGILLMSVVGKVTSPYPPLLGQTFVRGNQEAVFVDAITQVAYQPYEAFLSFDPAKEFGMTYRYERQEDEMLIYLVKRNNNEDLIATIPRDNNGNFWATWSHSLDDPLYTVEALPDEDDQLIIKAIDMTTGDWYIVGTYHFIGTPNMVYRINENILLIRRTNSGYFGLLNLETDTYFADRYDATNGFYFHHSDTTVFYRATRTFEGDETRSSKYFEMSLETFDPIEVLPPNEAVIIEEFLLFGLNRGRLVMTDDQDHLWFYDVAEKTYTPLADDYRRGQNSIMWSPDADRVSMMRLIDEETVELGIYTPAEDDFLPLLTLDEFSATVTLERFYTVQWSHEGDYLMITIFNPRGGSNDFMVYDAHTGEFLFDQDVIANYQFGFITWWRTSRP